MTHPGGLSHEGWQWDGGMWELASVRHHGEGNRETSTGQLPLLLPDRFLCRAERSLGIFRALQVHTGFLWEPVAGSEATAFHLLCRLSWRTLYTPMIYLCGTLAFQHCLRPVLGDLADNCVCSRVLPTIEETMACKQWILPCHFFIQHFSLPSWIFGFIFFVVVVVFLLLHNLTMQGRLA